MRITDMELEKLRTTPVEDVLAFFGKDTSHRGRMYLSPFREEKNPSLSVKDTFWYDFGTGEGGDAISMIRKLKDCTFMEAVQTAATIMGIQLGQGDKQGKPREWKRKEIKKAPKRKKMPSGSVILRYVSEIVSSPRLLAYARKRGISEGIVQRSLHQVSFYYIQNPSVYHTVLGFRNDSYGWELRSPQTKICNLKDITTYHHGSDTVVVFEGFFNYLSFLEILRRKKLSVDYDYVILNSVSLIGEAFPFLERHSHIISMTDNDAAGKACTERILGRFNTDEWYISTLKSLSGEKWKTLSKYNDLNDYLVGEYPPLPED